jgi:aminopeptidase
MVETELSKLAKILVQYSTKVQKGDRVVIRGFPLEANAAPLIRDVYRYVLEAGGHPHILIDVPGIDEIRLNEASDEQLMYVSPFVRTVVEDFEVDIRLSSSSNTKRLMSVDSKRLAVYQKAIAGLSDRWFQRSAEGSMRWVVTRFPTQAYAQDAEMSLEEYEEYLYRTTYADQEDAVSRYLELEERQRDLVKWLEGKQTLDLQGPDVNLKMSISGRKFINCSGQNNIPDGEIFTGPVEESLDGWIRFSYPTSYRGFAVEGVELTFENGKIEKVIATKGEELLCGILASDPGANYIGELGIGTNREIDRVTRDMLFDEKIWGTIHLALGAGYPETGSKNKSPLHWDMLCDMRDGGRIIVDGEVFYEGGEFLI